MATPGPVVIIGVGNDYRGDDGAGLCIARKIRDRNFPGVRVIDGVADGTDMINAWQGARRVLIIDAVSSKGVPGSVYKFDGLKDAIAEEIFLRYSTHAFSIPATIALARAIGQLPPSLVIYGIEGLNFSAGSTLSAPAAAGVDKAVIEISKEIRNSVEI